MEIGVYGGSFDPPHIGHALVSGWLLWSGRVEEVWLLPAFSHPFGKQSAPFEERVALCQALADTVDPARIRVCEVERDLPVPSYSIDTLGHLARSHPEHRFRLVIGADILPQTARWKDWDRIEAEHPPVVVGRAGYDSPEGTVVFPEVSSTEIRRRLAAGEPIDHLVLPAVAARLQGRIR